MRRWVVGVGLATLLVGAGLVASTFIAAPLPKPMPFAGELPVASPPGEMIAWALPTGVTHRSAAFAYRGGSFSDKREFAMTAVLVRHPKGDVLIDSGLGSDVDVQLQSMPWWFRAITSYSLESSSAQQLEAAKVVPSAVLLTHSHWDHASGLSALKNVPVWVTREEQHFIAEGGWLTAVARQFTRGRLVTYDFEGGPYLGFARSHDVFGDGSLVVVPAAGHTPGSVIVFLTLPGPKRFALVGDLVWQVEGVTEREERPLIQRTLGDADPAQVREAIETMAAIHERWPELVIVPSHDQRGFASLPVLGH